MGFFSGFGFGDIVKAVAGPLTGGLFSAVDKPKADYSGAKNQISWRVADAKRAGIHPLAALGVPSMGPIVSQSNMAPWAADAASNLAGMASRREQETLAAEKLRSDIALNNAMRVESMSRTANNYVEGQKLHSDLARSRQALNASQDQTLKLMPGDLKLGPHASAQEFEDEYGDAASWVYGAGRLLNDTLDQLHGVVRKRFPNAPKSVDDPSYWKGLY